MRYELLLIVGLTACGNGQAPNPFPGLNTLLPTPIIQKYDPPFQQLVEEFNREMRMRGLPPGIAPSSIRWEDLSSKDSKERRTITLGTCLISKGEIRVDRRAAIEDAQDKYKFKALIFHELAHCVYAVHGHDPEPGQLLSALATPIINWEVALDRLAVYINRHHIQNPFGVSND